MSCKIKNGLIIDDKEITEVSIDGLMSADSDSILGTEGADKTYVDIFASDPTVETKTAGYTLTAGDSGKIFTNKNATGAVGYRLPPVANGLSYTFINEVYGEYLPNLVDSNVIGLYHFENNVLDSSAYARTLTPYNSFAPTNAQNYIGAFSGDCIGTKYANLAFLGSDASLSTWTVEGYFYLSSCPVNVPLFSHNLAGVTTGFQYRLYWSSAGVWRYRDGGGDRSLGGTAFTGWRYVSLSYDASKVYLHINGVYCGSAYSTTPLPASATGGWNIGYGNSVNMNGYVDYFRVSKVARYPNTSSYTPPSRAKFIAIAPQDNETIWCATNRAARKYIYSTSTSAIKLYGTTAGWVATEINGTFGIGA